LLPITAVQVIANGLCAFSNIAFTGTPMKEEDYNVNGFVYRIPQ
jgi:hypothetical protein